MNHREIAIFAPGLSREFGEKVSAHLGVSQGRRGGRHCLASVHFSDLFAMFASGRTSESIEFPMPRLRLSDQCRSEWSEIYRLEA